MTPLASHPPTRVRVVDSHTSGAPTRVVIDAAFLAACDLGLGSVAARRDVFRERYDRLRRALLSDPRGSEAMVGVLLLPPSDPHCSLGAFYMNTVGYLDMCGHATLGLAVSLGTLGRIAVGTFQLETPAGRVAVTWHGGNEASFENISPQRTARGLSLACADGRLLTGDIATAGLWFFSLATMANAWPLSRFPNSLRGPGPFAAHSNCVALPAPVAKRSITLCCWLHRKIQPTTGGHLCSARTARLTARRAAQPPAHWWRCSTRTACWKQKQSGGRKAYWVACMPRACGSRPACLCPRCVAGRGLPPRVTCTLRRTTPTEQACQRWPQSGAGAGSSSGSAVFF